MKEKLQVAEPSAAGPKILDRAGIECLIGCILACSLVVLGLVVWECWICTSIRITLVAETPSGEKLQAIRSQLSEKQPFYATFSRGAGWAWNGSTIRQAPRLFLACRSTVNAYLDGRYLGNGPCDVAMLTSGVHDLVLVGPDEAVRRFAVPLVSGATANFAYRWDDTTAKLVLNFR